MTMRLKKGEIRNIIQLPESYGERITIGGERVTFRPTIEVSVFKDKWGRYTVAEKGHRLTPAEKRLGLKRTRTAEAKFIKQQFETSGPKTHMRKLDVNKVNKGDKTFKPWEVNATKGWIDTKRGSFIGKNKIGRTGEMEQLMKSLDATTGAINNGFNFRELWASLNDDQKFAVMTRLQEMEWDDFWNNWVDSDGDFSKLVDVDRQVEALEAVMSVIQKVLE